MGFWSACALAAVVPSSAPGAPRAGSAWAFERQKVTQGGSYRPDHRLRRPSEFAAVMASRSRLRGGVFELRYRDNGSAGARLGVVIPKRLAKRAVLRNRLKRLIRETFRISRSGLPAQDLVFRLSRSLGSESIDSDSNIAWRREIESLLAGLKR